LIDNADISDESVILSKPSEKPGISFWKLIESRFNLRWSQFTDLEGESGFEYKRLLFRQDNIQFGRSYFFSFSTKELKIFTRLYWCIGNKLILSDFLTEPGNYEAWSFYTPIVREYIIFFLTFYQHFDNESLYFPLETSFTPITFIGSPL
jgi:hypothetical protein